jgi:hypothetical protein
MQSVIAKTRSWAATVWRQLVGAPIEETAMNDESVKQSVEDALLQAYAGRCEACHTSPFTGVLRSAVA